ELGEKYQVPVYSYTAFDHLMKSGDVDAVYIALPNALHREYTERAARAGMHVLCEKPLAHTADDCRAMIDVCATHHVHLMTAYRLHFEEANLSVVDVVRSGRLGDARLFHSVFTQQVEKNNFRLD